MVNLVMKVVHVKTVSINSNRMIHSNRVKEELDSDDMLVTNLRTQ